MEYRNLIRSHSSKKVLAINLKDTSLVQQDLTGSDNQFWIISGKMDSAQIMNKAFNKYLTSGREIVFEDFNSGKVQPWKLELYSKIRKEMDSCNCKENFEFIKDRIETSYSGFQDKVNQSTKADYEKSLAQTEETARTTNNTSVCFKAISKYLAFFQDRHVHLNVISNQTNTKNQSGSSIFKKNVSAEWFNIKNIDDSTLMLSLPSFSGDNKKLIDQLIDKNKNKILKTPYLLIDIRGNGGGTDQSFYSVLPFLYTNSYALKGNDILASKYNIEIFEGFEYRLKSTKNTDNERKWLGIILDRMKKNPGQFVLRSEDNVVRRDTVLRNPRKVGILINSGCASSAEEFLLNARESKKVILFGQPTSGTLDYSNVINVPCPSLAFKFGYATTRSHRLPDISIDKDKIRPNIYLDNDQDWIEIASKKLKGTK